MRLFVDRARRAHDDFRLRDDNVADVVAVCDRLDGIPLAIELAAARCKLLTPAQLRAGLTDAVGVLGSGPRTVDERHQTIERSIEWSHSLLSPSARVALRRTGVFAGPFSLDAAVAVIPGGEVDAAEVLDATWRSSSTSPSSRSTSTAAEVTLPAAQDGPPVRPPRAGRAPARWTRSPPGTPTTSGERALRALAALPRRALGDPGPGWRSVLRPRGHARSTSTEHGTVRGGRRGGDGVLAGDGGPPHGRSRRPGRPGRPA